MAVDAAHLFTLYASFCGNDDDDDFYYGPLNGYCLDGDLTGDAVSYPPIVAAAAGAGALQA